MGLAYGFTWQCPGCGPGITVVRFETEVVATVELSNVRLVLRSMCGDQVHAPEAAPSEALRAQVEEEYRPLAVSL